MVAQPGEMWLYNMCSDILGVLIARVWSIAAGLSGGADFRAAGDD